jgi:hypothetical protein
MQQHLSGEQQHRGRSAPLSTPYGDAMALRIAQNRGRLVIGEEQMFDITAAIAYAVRMLYLRKSTVSAGEETSLLVLGLHTTLPSATSTLDTCNQVDAIRRYKGQTVQ